MKTHAGHASLRPSALLLVAVCLAASGAAAQTERVQLRLVPLPDQWVQFHLVQEMMTAPSDKDGKKALPDIHVKTLATFTQTTGHPDQDGRVRAEVTYDELSATITTAGQTKPAPVPSALLGQQMIATYDAQGKLLDIQPPDEMPAPVVAQIRQMMTSVFSGLGSNSFAVGETVSMPIDMTMPSATAAAPALTGTMSMTLRSIGEEGGERIAHFNQKMQLSMGAVRKLPNAGSATQARTMTMSMEMVGGGTMDYNVNRGFMVANRLEATIDTKTSFDHPLPKGMPNLDMHMIMKTSIDATY